MAEQRAVNSRVEGSSPSSTATWIVATTVDSYDSNPRIYVRDCPHCNYEVDVEQIYYDHYVKCTLQICRYCEREFIAVFKRAECDICNNRIDCLCWPMLYIEETE